VFGALEAVTTKFLISLVQIPQWQWK